MRDVAYPLTEVANGVIYQGKFYPYQQASLGSVNQSLSPKLNSRLYVKTVNTYVRLAAGDLTTYVGLSGTTNKSGVDVFYVTTVPNVAQAVNISVNIGVLYDRSLPVFYAQGGGLPTDCWFGVIYAEVDDV